MNWGYRIIVAFVAGVCFILFFVVKSMHIQTEMVEDDYYAKELKFDGQIAATANLAESVDEATIKMEGDHVALSMDTVLSNNLTSGTVYFYYAASSRADKTYQLRKSATGEYTFNRKDLRPGKYLVKLSFESNGTPYYKEQVLFLPK